MTQAGKTFRIFVSSTFSNPKDERKALQRHGFAKLRQAAAVLVEPLGSLGTSYSSTLCLRRCVCLQIKPGNCSATRRTFL